MRTFFSLCVVVVCSMAFGAEPFVKKANIPYVSGGGERQQLDIYLPLDYEKAEKPFPVICFIHGGGWAGRTPSQTFAANIFVAKGYAIAEITYRFVPQDPMPAQVIDCKAAVRWLKAHAEEYNLDANRFVAWGHSAGGHLAAFLGAGGAKEFDVGENLDQSSTVRAVVNYFGPTDLVGYGAEKSQRFKKLFGGTFEEKKDLAERMSPISHVTKTSSPMLIVHAVNDETVPISHSRKLHQALQKAGVESELFELSTGGHSYRKLTSPETIERMTTFFEKHLMTSPLILEEVRQD